MSDADPCPAPHPLQRQPSLLSNHREVQCLVCSRLHQMFIADPNIAKLVHFQVRMTAYHRPPLHPLSGTVKNHHWR